jgi:hypothetical protein
MVLKRHIKEGRWRAVEKDLRRLSPPSPDGTGGGNVSVTAEMLDEGGTITRTVNKLKKVTERDGAVAALASALVKSWKAIIAAAKEDGDEVFDMTEERDRAAAAQVEAVEEAARALAAESEAAAAEEAAAGEKAEAEEAAAAKKDEAARAVEARRVEREEKAANAAAAKQAQEDARAEALEAARREKEEEEAAAAAAAAASASAAKAAAAVRAAKEAEKAETAEEEEKEEEEKPMTAFQKARAAAASRESKHPFSKPSAGKRAAMNRRLASSIMALLCAACLAIVAMSCPVAAVSTSSSPTDTSSADTKASKATEIFSFSICTPVEVTAALLVLRMVPYVAVSSCSGGGRWLGVLRWRRGRDLLTRT